jgi:hypothetical protein
MYLAKAGYPHPRRIRRRRRRRLASWPGEEYLIWHRVAGESLARHSDQIDFRHRGMVFLGSIIKRNDQSEHSRTGYLLTNPVCCSKSWNELSNNVEMMDIRNSWKSSPCAVFPFGNGWEQGSISELEIHDLEEVLSESQQNRRFILVCMPCWQTLTAFHHPSENSDARNPDLLRCHLSFVRTEIGQVKLSNRSTPHYWIIYHRSEPVSALAPCDNILVPDHSVSRSMI